MGVLNDDFMVGETGLFRPQGIRGTTAPVRALSHSQGRYGIIPSHYNFFGILEKYNPDTCTFFTLVGEMDFSLHEMFEVSGLFMGDLPYEEYIPNTEELHLLKQDAPRCTRPTGRSCTISIFAFRWPDRGLEESSKCLGPTIS